MAVRIEVKLGATFEESGAFVYSSEGLEVPCRFYKIELITEDNDQLSLTNTRGTGASQMKKNSGEATPGEVESSSRQDTRRR